MRMLRAPTWIAASAFGLLLTPPLAAQGGPQRLTYDNRPDMTQKDGEIELRKGPWVRTARFEADAQLTFEYLPTKDDTEVSVTLGVFLSRGEITSPGYQLTLPTASAPRLSLQGANARTLETGEVPFTASQWQRIVMLIGARTVTVTVNGRLASKFAVEPFAGYVLFRVREGAVRLRNINLEPITPGFELAESVRTLRELDEQGGTKPRLKREVKPVYPIGAMVDKSRGIVMVKAVVLPDGTVGQVQVTKSLHPELDKSAVTAVRKWVFEPATLKGTAIPVIVEVELTFTLE
jgi:TonB family protein